MRTQKPIRDPFTLDEDGDWTDGTPPYLSLDLAISECETFTFEGTDKLRLACLGQHAGDCVGFDLVINRVFPWGLRTIENYPQECFDGTVPFAHFNPDGWVEDGLTIESRGMETLRILDFVQTHYGLSPRTIPGYGTPGKVSMNAMAFVPEEHDAFSNYTEVKLSYDGFNESDGLENAFWQAFIRIDPKIGAIRFEEKDVDFRQAQINTLANAFR